MFTIKIPPIILLHIPEVREIDLDLVKETILPASNLRKRVEYLSSNSGLAKSPIFSFEHRKYGHQIIHSNCRGTASWVLGWDEKIKDLWLQAHPENWNLNEEHELDGVYLSKDGFQSGYVGRKSFDLFLEKYAQQSSRKVPGCLIEICYEGLGGQDEIGDPKITDIRHSLVYLGSAFEEDLIFHQNGEGSTFEFALWKDYIDKLEGEQRGIFNGKRIHWAKNYSIKNN